LVWWGGERQAAGGGINSPGGIAKGIFERNFEGFGNARMGGRVALGLLLFVERE